eukprot:753374-Hanusia_phi.AAC.4
MLGPGPEVVPGTETVTVTRPGPGSGPSRSDPALSLKTTFWWGSAWWHHRAVRTPLLGGVGVQAGMSCGVTRVLWV